MLHTNITSVYLWFDEIAPAQRARPLWTQLTSICDSPGVGGISNAEGSATRGRGNVYIIQVEIQIGREYRDEQGYKSTLLQVYNKIHPT